MSASGAGQFVDEDEALMTQRSLKFSMPSSDKQPNAPPLFYINGVLGLESLLVDLYILVWRAEPGILLWSRAALPFGG